MFHFCSTVLNSCTVTLENRDVTVVHLCIIHARRSRGHKLWTFSYCCSLSLTAQESHYTHVVGVRSESARYEFDKTVVYDNRGKNPLFLVTCCQYEKENTLLALPLLNLKLVICQAFKLHICPQHIKNIYFFYCILFELVYYTE